MRSRADLFRGACCCAGQELQEYYRQAIASGAMSRQEFHVSNGELVHNDFRPSKYCHKCGQEVSADDFDIDAGRMGIEWRPAHKKCVDYPLSDITSEQVQ